MRISIAEWNADPRWRERLMRRELDHVVVVDVVTRTEMTWYPPCRVMWFDGTASDIDPIVKLDDFDFRAFLEQRKAWSETTFGPGFKPDRIVAHIEKELDEIEHSPRDVVEWIDIVFLALDGASRAGASTDQIIETLERKFAENRTRQWPDWRTVPDDQPIEHVRDPSEVHERYARKVSDGT